MTAPGQVLVRRGTARERRARLRAVGAVAGDALAAGAARIEEMHLGISGRVFAVVPASAPVRIAHDALSRGAHRAVRGGLRTLGRLGGGALAVSPLAEGERLDGRGAALLGAAVSGMYGDHIARRHPRLALAMTLRSGGRDVPIERQALAETYPAAGRRLAVFLHGLCETEDWWGRPAQDEDTPGTYGDRLRRQLRVTPLFVRFNTGLHVSENGALLAELLDRLLDAWPDEVEELSLIGHSMGGLVIRSACDAGRRQGRSWVPRVRHCVYLGTPHDGAPLERGVNMLAGTLRRLPETRALASFLDVRSAGIKDLRFGYLRDEDWRGHDPDAVLVDTGADVPLLPTARHHCVAATLGATPAHVLSRLLGDLLVLHDSAAGLGHRGAPLPLEEGDRRHIGRLTHFHLLDHPAVAELLRDWLTGPPQLQAASDPACLPR